MRRLILLILFSTLTIPCSARTITVNNDTPADYNNIQAAIDAAANGDTILVADGVYRGPNNRNLDFKGKTITLKSQNGPINCIIDCQNKNRGFYFHQRETSASIVDGFAITNGSQSEGAGIYCYDQSSPTIKNCIIHGNRTTSSGGGIYCGYFSASKIIDCIIINNKSDYSGAGLYCYNASPTLTNCVIAYNSSNSYGGGLYGSYSAVVALNCSFIGNSSGSYGGAIRCSYSSPSFTNCIFSNNKAQYYGGAIYCSSQASPIITNCTFNSNTAAEIGGAVHCSYNTAPVMTNCIFSDNSKYAISKEFSSTPTAISIRYCSFYNNSAGDYYDQMTNITYTGAAQINASVQGAEKNIDGNPNFAFSDDIHLLSGSACIDKGTSQTPSEIPPTDMDGSPRTIDGNADTIPVIDIGAIEYNPDRPVIASSPAILEFIRQRNGPNPSPQALKIRNCDGGILNWQIEHDCPWLTADPNKGNCTGETDQITVSVNTDPLPQGVYITTLSIIDPNAGNNPRRLLVILRIKGTLHVPEQYSTIQQAVDAAMEGEAIEVAPGTYNGTISINTKLNLIGFDQPLIDIKGISSQAVGIYADGCTVDGFKIIGGSIGIYAESSNNTISNNILSQNNVGLQLYQDPNNVLTNNEICDNKSTGLYIYNSSQNVLKNNNIHNNPVNFQIDGSSESNYTQGIDTTNTVDGKPIYYLVGQTNILIDASTNAGCVAAVNCTQITIKDLALSNNGKAILLVKTTNSRIESVTASNNSQAGIWLEDSPRNTILTNTLSNNNYGIKLLRSPNSNLRENIMLSNRYNFACEGNIVSDYYQNVLRSNTADGKSICYLVEEIGTVIDSSSNASCVFAVDCSGIVIRDLILENNGTGVAFVSVTNSTIENITAASNETGILIRDCSNNILRHNDSSYNLTGITMLTAKNTQIDRSTVSTNMLGISCSASEIQISFSVINNNYQNGGIKLAGGSNASISNCTIFGNAVPEYYYWPDFGAGINCEYVIKATVWNSIIWANRPAQIGQQNSVTVSFSDIQDGFPGEGNINALPLLTPDGHLCAGSPCIDKGDPRKRPSSSSQDIDGEILLRRILDIGCDEYIDTDSDGLPDWYETTYFGSSNAAQPDQDPDGDELSNIAEYKLYSSNPAVPCTIYYVDANRPDDSNDGLSKQTAKKTIQAAIQRTDNSDKIIIAPGRYDEDVNPLGRQIIIQSTNHLDATVVDSTILAGNLALTTGEMPGCTIKGLTISNPDGTAITCTGTSPTIANCTITASRGNNYDQGGGISCLNASPLISHCTISANTASYRGGGIYCSLSSPVIRNSVICGNTSNYGYGGDAAAFYLSESNVAVYNCTIADNTGPDMYTSYTPILCEKSNLFITNSILWNNVTYQINNTESSVTITYSNIKGAVQASQSPWQGTGNINADPLFVKSGYWSDRPYYTNALWIDGDYHLQSEGWRWVPHPTHGSNWVWDAQTSRCIDAGNPAAPLDNEPLTVPVDPANEWGKNIRIDMGAYGGTSEASMPPLGWALLADLNNNGVVDWCDFASIASNWRTHALENSSDLNRNSVTDSADLSLMAEDWLKTTIWHK